MTVKIIFSLAPILLSGLVATAVTFFLNLRDERRRAVRDYATKFFETTRADVRSAMDAGVAYFSATSTRRIRVLEADVYLHERDVRASLANIAESWSGDESALSSLAALRNEFLKELTGGQFGTAAPTQDLERAKAVVNSGAKLRQELARLRQGQLNRARIGHSAAFAAWLMGGLLLLAALSFAAGLFAGATLS